MIAAATMSVLPELCLRSVFMLLEIADARAVWDRGIQERAGRAVAAHRRAGIGGGELDADVAIVRSARGAERCRKGRGTGHVAHNRAIGHQSAACVLHRFDPVIARAVVSL